MRLKRLLVISALLAATGCATSNRTAGNPEKLEAAKISFHLAYPEAAPGARELTDREGRTVYVAGEPILTLAHIETVRALRSDRGASILQIVFTRFGARRLRDVTADHYQDDTLVYGVYGREGHLEVEAYLAVMVDETLLCALPIDAVMTGGEIHLYDLMPPWEARRLAERLRK